MLQVRDVVRSCGPRLRSLWRFVRVGRRPPAASKPADVNSLVCEDEEECFLSVEYRVTTAPLHLYFLTKAHYYIT